MRIAFFGSSLVSAYWNGAATYYRGIIRALAELGYEITFFEPDAFDRQKHRDMQDPDWARVVVYPATEEAARSALAAARSADIIIKASGVGVFDELLEAGALALKEGGRQVIYWDVDAPATLERLHRDPGDPLRALLPHYDLVLTYGGGSPVVEAFKRFGVESCVPVYNALDTSTHFPVPAQPRFTADLAFLGNRLPDRESRVEAFFLAPAARLPNRRFLLGGNGWGDKPMPPNVHYLGHVYTDDHNAFNCSAMAVLNINRESMAQTGFSPATRIFEAAGAGACIISDAWAGIETFLEPDREILIARNGDEVAFHLEALTPARAAAIGAAALRRVRKEHTYIHRASRVDNLLRSLRAGDAA